MIQFFDICRHDFGVKFWKLQLIFSKIIHGGYAVTDLTKCRFRPGKRHFISLWGTQQGDRFKFDHRCSDAQLWHTTRPWTECPELANSLV